MTSCMTTLPAPACCNATQGEDGGPIDPPPTFLSIGETAATAEPLAGGWELRIPSTRCPHIQSPLPPPFPPIATTPVLANILLFDQLTRNVFRKQPHSFAFDSLALAMSREVGARVITGDKLGSALRMVQPHPTCTSFNPNFSWWPRGVIASCVRLRWGH